MSDPAADLPDELDEFIAEQMADPAFAAAYVAVETREAIMAALSDRRRAIGLTQSQLAEIMQVSQATVSGFETGSTDPRLGTLTRYARAVGCRLAFTLEPIQEN